MKCFEDEKILGLLLQATKARKLQWKPYNFVDDGKGYCTFIDNCRVCVATNTSDEKDDYVMQLHNVNDEVFYHEEFSRDYKPIAEPMLDLLLAIDEQYLMKEESWKRISNGLRRLVGDTERRIE